MRIGNRGGRRGPGSIRAMRRFERHLTVMRATERVERERRVLLRTRSLLFLALPIAGLCAFKTRTEARREPSVPLPNAVALKWKTEPAMTHARSAHAIASTGSAIFVVGGTGASESSTEVKPVLEIERFDGKSWSVVTELPNEGLNAPAAVIFEKHLWVIGGFGTTSNVPVANVRVLDLETSAWSDAPPLPAPRGGHAAIVFGGKIHVLGGGNSRSTLADHCAFDPEKRAWEERA